MLRFQWNALRIGDRVLVHDSGTAPRALAPGVVTLIDTHRGVNGVGIRMATVSGARLFWPAFRTVHPDPVDPTEPCWRCSTEAAAP